MPSRIRTAVAIATGLLAAHPLSAQGPIKIGTIAPQNSIYAKTLHQMGEGWKSRTNGRVTYTILAGGDESEEGLLRNMRPNFRKLHAAQLSAITLANLDDAFNVFGLPMFFESYAEADRVLEKLGPVLEQRLEAKGYQALNWAYVGWIQIFSKTPITRVDDLKRLKLYTSTGDDRLARWYKNNGFTAVQIDSTAIITSLKTSMIEAVPSPPLFAQLLTWYQSAPYMMDLGFAPLLGATVMSTERWNALSAEDQAIIVDEARKAGARLRSDVPRLDREAIEAMRGRGLTVTKGDVAEWRRLAEQLGDAMRRDGVVQGDIYDLAKRERDAVRAGK
jgi:TRAP-type C4-dicarboxylate transport system substrate-binding protein